jgi:hypothetical protein
MTSNRFPDPRWRLDRGWHLTRRLNSARVRYGCGPRSGRPSAGLALPILRLGSSPVPTTACTGNTVGNTALGGHPPGVGRVLPLPPNLSHAGVPAPWAGTTRAGLRREEDPDRLGGLSPSTASDMSFPAIGTKTTANGTLTGWLARNPRPARPVGRQFRSVEATAFLDVMCGGKLLLERQRPAQPRVSLTSARNSWLGRARAPVNRPAGR